MTDLEGLLREHAGAPAHAPDFETRLWETIAAEATQAAMATPAAITAGAAARRGSAPARKHLLRRVLLAAAAVAAAAALAIGLAVSRHTVAELQHPPVASAAEVAANIRAALAEVRTIHADASEYSRPVAGPQKSDWRKGWTTADWWARAHIYSDDEAKSLGFESAPRSAPSPIVVTADGRWRLDNPDGGDQYVGDERIGILQAYWPSDALFVTRDVSLGPPDSDRGSHTIELSVDLSFIQPAYLAEMARGVVGQTSVNGRPALTVSCAIAPQPIAGLNMDSHLFDTVRYTVDEQTWLVVRTSYLLKGQVVLEIRLSHVRVNEPVREDEFTLTSPVSTRVKVEDLGFRRASFAEAATIWPTHALAPTTLPEGYSPFAAAVAASARFRYFTYTHGYQKSYWPESSEVTQLAYRAGMLQVVVTTRRQPAGGPLPDELLVTDPFVTESAGDDRVHTGTVKEVRLTGGAWSGATAYLVAPLLSQPHLWAWRDGILVTIGGDLTAEQLLEAANSLQPLD